MYKYALYFNKILSPLKKYSTILWTLQVSRNTVKSKVLVYYFQETASELNLKSNIKN